jgi:uncharacterized membrane protein YtjA (UPF0391 family)
MLRWSLFFFTISVVAGVLQSAQFIDGPEHATEIAVLHSLAFLIAYILFLVFGLLALGSPESNSNGQSIMNRIRVLSGWR